jgi:hypothetical protein
MPCSASDGSKGGGPDDRSARCEAILAGLGFGESRVLIDGAAARIVTDAAGIGRLSDPSVSDALHDGFRREGLFFVSVDCGDAFFFDPAGGLVAGLPPDSDD